MKDPPRLLLVEDDPGIAILESEIIEDLGYQVLTAPSGRDALACLTRQTLDFMLLDYSLPDMTAIELLQQLRARQQPVPPFIVTTGAGDEYVAVEMMRLGALNYLIKDQVFLEILPETLQRALRELELKDRLAAAEQAAAEQLSRYRTLMHGSMDGVVLLDAQACFVDVNEAYARMMGYRPEELIGQPLSLLKSPEDASKIPELLARIRKESPCRLESRNLARDGRIVLVEVSAVYDPSHGVMAFVRDVTALRHNEARLRLASKVLEGSAQAIMVTDQQHRILDVNPAFSHITRYSSDLVLGQTPEMLLPGWTDDADINHRIQTALTQFGQWQGEVSLRRRDGEIFTAWFSISAVTAESGQPPVFVSLFSDISSVKVVAEHLEYLAHHDPLTKLPNRLLFGARLRHSLERAERAKQGLGLLYLDLDHFKEVNDRLGHAAGDDLLCDVSTRMSGLVREEDTLARLGGDEFVVLIEGASKLADLERVVATLLGIFPIPVPTPQGPVVVTASIGGALYPRDATTADALMACADEGMYAAKSAGRNTFRMVEPRTAAADDGRMFT